jgi:hypothetical protein
MTDLQIRIGLRGKPNGFVSKQDSLMTLCEAVQVVAPGGAYFGASVSDFRIFAHTETRKSRSAGFLAAEVTEGSRTRVAPREPRSSMLGGVQELAGRVVASAAHSIGRDRGEHRPGTISGLA